MSRLKVAAATSVMVLLTFAVYLRTMAPTITWRHNGADSGDLVTAAINLGVPHPTGYPLYTLVAHFFTLVPWAEPAWMVTLFSALAGSLAVGTVFWAAYRFVQRQGGGDRVALAAAWAGAGLLAFGELLWSQATIAEVYALTALLVATLLAAGLLAPPRIRPHLLALLFGLSLAHHVIVALFLPALWPYASAIRRWLTRRRAAALTLLLLPGLLTYAYIPLAARTHSVPNWGGADTASGLLWLVSGAAYRRYLGMPPAPYLLQRLSAWASIWVRDFGIPGLGLALFGLSRGLQSDRRFTVFGLNVVAFYSVYAMFYVTTDSYLYLLPAAVLASLWAAQGAALVLGALQDWAQAVPARRLAVLLGTLALIALPVASLAGRFAAMDLSRDREAYRFAEAVLEAAVPDAIVISNGDAQTFPLWYLRYGLKKRPDAVVIDRNLLAFAWYREDLARQHPALTDLPDTHDSQAAAIVLIEAVAGRRPVHLTYADDTLLRAARWAAGNGQFYTLVGGAP